MSILDLVYPKKCVGCGREGRYLCPKCLDKMNTPTSLCPMCHKASIDGMAHIKCKKPWGADRLITVWRYDGVVRKSLLKLKYNFASDLASEIVLATILSAKKQDIVFPVKAFLVPVPLHKKRANWRGFNQSEALGKVLAKRLKWAFASDLIVRKEFKIPQTNLKGRARRSNVKGVFSLNSGIGNNAENSAEIVVFDDVYTTGSTMKEVVKVLKRGGFKKVTGMTVAR